MPPNRLSPSPPVERFLLGEILSRDLQLQAMGESDEEQGEYYQTAKGAKRER